MQAMPRWMPLWNPGIRQRSTAEPGPQITEELAQMSTNQRRVMVPVTPIGKSMSA